jgi:hypothetical protein
MEDIVSSATGLNDNKTSTITAATNEPPGLSNGVDGVSTRLFSRSEEILVKVNEDNDTAAANVTKNRLRADDHSRG